MPPLARCQLWVGGWAAINQRTIFGKTRGLIEVYSSISIIFKRTEEATSDKVLESLQQKGFKGKILQNSLTVDEEGDENQFFIGGLIFYKF